MTSLEKLQKILDAHYPAQRGPITLETRLEQLDIDSLGMMELFFAIEDEFGISVPNDKRALQTVGDLLDYIGELSTQQGIAATAGRKDTAPAEGARAAR